MRYFFSAPSGHRNILSELGAQNYLLSFAVDGKHCDRFHDSNGQFNNLIIDSGAFSVWNKGGEIDIEKYIQFCQSKPLYWNYINLDVIPETGSSQKDIDICCEKGFENYLYISSKVANVMPVYHYGDNLKWLKKYLEYTDYIGISPANDTHENVKRAFLKTVFKNIPVTTKTHGLGYSSIEGLMIFPFYSVDSISWKRCPMIVNNQKKGYFANSKMEYILRDVIKRFLYNEKFITDLWNQRGITWS